ncbi:hypothetical protein [Euzebya tangerina]|uniref:hypothetical protein n=1 Tax=Euzebya tangerina TaxID=591198 RepID=UPI000E31AEEB|nr:hypothetical protein [Euzebya tangerina]
MDRYERLAQLAASQGGHVAAWQCRVIGIPNQWVHEQRRRRGWSVVHEGVYRLPGVPSSWTGDLWAALLSTAAPRARKTVESAQVSGQLNPPLGLTLSPHALVTAWSAAKLYGFERPPPARPQLLLPQDTRNARSGIHVTRTRLFPDHVLRDGLPCAPPARVLWDAAWIGRKSGGVAKTLHDFAVFLDRTRVFAVAEFLATVDEPVLDGLPRRVPRALRRTAELLSPGFSHSRTEARARQVVQRVAAARGLVASSRPVPIRKDGRIVAEADIAIESLRWDIEIDGPHHSFLAVQRRDRRRDQGLTGIDWITSRYPTELLDESLTDFEASVATDLDRIVSLRRRDAAA